MAINTNYSTIPIQKLPMSKKNKKWKEANIDSYVGRATASSVRGKSESEDLKIKYDLYNSKFDIKDIEYVVDPFKVGDTLPGSPQNFNIIRPKIDLLIGEESKRPETLKVIQSGDSGASKAEGLQLDLLMQYVISKIGGQSEDQTKTPEQIQKYIQYEYSDIAEKTAYYALKYLKEKLNTRNEFLKGWKDSLIAGKEIYYVGVNNGEPYLERVNPIGFYYDKSPDVEFIEDGDWAIRHMLMSPAAIHDKFYDKLSNSDLDKLLEISGGSSYSANKPSDVNYNKVLYRETPSRDTGFAGGSGNESGNYLDVYHVTWKSLKKVGFITTIDENGEEVEDIVDETYKANPDENISWEWVTEVWEGYKVGSDIYLGIEPLDNQNISVENPNSQKLPYVGAIYSDDNSEYTSLIDVMRPLQYMYIIIWFRLEVALARDKGRVLTMDITQIPKSMGIDVAKWMHYLSTLGVNLVNPYEEGWDIPGRAGGQASSFNQISSLDLSMSKVIADYIQLMTKIEDMIGELTGVSRQRQGSISTNELVGNVERSVIQSSHITEPLFWKHNQVKKRAYSILLDAAKSAWSDSNKKKLHFIMDDTSRAFIDLTEDFTLSDFDIFISDSSKEDRDIQALKNLSQAAVQGGASLSEIAEMITLDNVTMIKNKLKDLEVKKQQIEEQRAEAERQSELEKVQIEMDQKAEENRIKEEDSIRKAETQLEVAYIQAASKEGDGDNFDKLLIDKEKVDLQRNKQESEETMASRKLAEETRKNRVNETIKRDELEIKRKQANKPKTT